VSAPHGGKKRRWLVTGGLGFIGSNFIRLVLRERPDVSVTNYDAMTYAGNPANVADVVHDPRYRFIHADICDERAVDAALSSGFDAIVNFAAESHVDRSILAPKAFLSTDIMGTHTLLEAARRHAVARFLQVSTDEVYGHVPRGESKESDAIAPRSPYAASKAGADLQVLAYASTYGSPVLITRGSNTYGPYQYPEKLIPLFVTNLLDDTPVPVYGLHVEDHARGILHVLEHGALGEVYNLGGKNERTNLDITHALVGLCGRSFETHVRHVIDRAGHDRRYSLDSSKANRLGWHPERDFAQGLSETVAWYRGNERWWRPLRDGTFSEYYRRQYVERTTR
jgi:dTDP-glucose 4,6-dehydratase